MKWMLWGVALVSLLQLYRAHPSEILVKSDIDSIMSRVLHTESEHTFFAALIAPVDVVPAELTAFGGIALHIAAVTLSVGPLNKHGITKTMFDPLAYSAKSSDHNRSGAITLDIGVAGSSIYGASIFYDAPLQLLVGALIADGEYRQMHLAYTINILADWSIAHATAYTAIDHIDSGDTWFVDDFIPYTDELVHSALVVRYAKNPLNASLNAVLQLSGVQLPQYSLFTLFEFSQTPIAIGAKVGILSEQFVDETGDWNEEWLQLHIWYAHTIQSALLLEAEFSDTHYRAPGFDNAHTVYSAPQTQKALINVAGTIPIAKSAQDSRFITIGNELQYNRDTRADADYLHRMRIVPKITAQYDVFVGDLSVAVENIDWEWDSVAAHSTVGLEFAEVTMDVRARYDYPLRTDNQETLLLQLSVDYSPTWGTLSGSITVDDLIAFDVKDITAVVTLVVKL